MQAWIALTAIFCSVLAPSSGWFRDDNTSPSDLALIDSFSKIFPGRYDNEHQRLCAEAMASSKLPTRIHCTIAHVNIRVLKENASLASETFFIEQYRNNDPADIYRRRVYHVRPDQRGRLVMVVYHLVNGTRFRNAHYRPALLENLSMDDLKVATGCDVLWERQSDSHFVSKMLQDKCVSNWAGTPILARDSNILTKDFMTMDFQFYKVSNLELVGTSKFNMTKLTAPLSLDSIHTLQEALLTGSSLRHSLDLRGECRDIGRSFSSLVKDFSLINSSRNGLQVTARGEWFREKDNLVEPEVMTFVIKQLQPGGWEVQVLRQPRGKCTVSGNSASVFTSSQVGLLALGNQADIKRAIEEGSKLHFVLDYRKCQAGNTSMFWDNYAIGGEIQSAYIDHQGDVVFSALPPSQLPQYNICRDTTCPTHTVHVTTDGDVNVNIIIQRPGRTGNVERRCRLHGQHPEGSLKVFSVAGGGGGRPVVCYGDTQDEKKPSDSACRHNVNSLTIGFVLLSVSAMKMLSY